MFLTKDPDEFVISDKQHYRTKTEIMKPDVIAEHNDSMG